MKRYAFLLALLTGTALAADDIYIPGTAVSYNRSKNDQGQNNSTLYIDEMNDTTNKTYVGFQCDKGAPYFFLASKNPLITPQMYKSEKYPTLTYTVDKQAARTLATQPWGEGEEFDQSRLLIADEADAPMFNSFRKSTSKVVLRVARPGLGELLFTFPTKGFEQAYKAINSCK